MNIIKLDTAEAVETANVIVEDLAVNSRVKVNSQPTFEVAKNQLGVLKEIKKSITEKKESITKPLNEALKNVRSLFRPAEEKIEVIETYLKSEVLSYNNKLILEQRKREEEAMKKIEEAEKENKEVNFDKISKPVERVAEKIEAIKTRKMIRMRITDVNLIPREFMLPDERAIMDSLKLGKPVAGAELYEEEIAVNSY